MKRVGAYEAKTHLPRLLDEVAKGEMITITKHGVPVAMLEHALSAYDASYLELAARQGLPLATQHARLIVAARRAGVLLVQ